MKTAIDAVSDKQIATLANDILNSTNSLDSGRTSYLRLMVAATHAELAHKRGTETVVQLAALRAVHVRFYEIVLREAEAHVPQGTRGRSVLLHKRANFARTTLSALRNHVRAGADICALKAEKVTKGALSVREGPRILTPRRLRTVAERYSKGLLGAFEGLAEVDKPAAIEGLQAILAQVTKRLASLNRPTKRREAPHMMRTGDGAWFNRQQPAQPAQPEARPS